jgi:hypothetical protein
MNEFPSKNKKRAQRRYRDRKAQQRRIDKFKHVRKKRDVELSELPEVVEMDNGQVQGLGNLHLGRDQDTTGRQMRETLGSTPDVGPGADLEATA